MIYLMTSNGGRLIIMDDDNLKRLKEGKPATTPDGNIQIVYQPDLMWLASQLELHYKEGKSISGEVIASLITIGKDKPPKSLPDGYTTKAMVSSKEKLN